MKLDENIINILKTDEPSIQELRKTAKNLNIRLRRSMKKRDILKEIKKKLLELDTQGLLENKSSNNKKTERKNTKKMYLEPKELKKTYKKNKLEILPVNYEWIYIFWDFDEKTKKLLNNDKIKNNVILRFCDENDFRIFETHINISNMNNYYFNLNDSNKNYYARIGYLKDDGIFKEIMKSKNIFIPSKNPSIKGNEEWFNIKKQKIISKPVKLNTYIKPIEEIKGNSFGNYSLSS
ncbi:DUF4912 domain-containing protein [Oceanotoga sp. DSM 15011]|jgi:hypothetical protein|uniref:DUF4912 domain-containing protein n=1 Tax=Oceanotoga TaxID=1255275 RepID=UPI0021F435CE|nr:MULTISPECIES: DUF4912 domain-containing protein [Oceanotoga]MDN5343111.1 uncharacterized protein [Oceanotoga sp.]MDO7977564.1 DUF4912 domain-containing protein [Oceanotoga teriensis]UYO99691.1 DUF4912 domain-containing protein [Oceanotoga sp. DSM 15011]